MVEVMKITATSFKRSHACMAVLSAPSPAAGHRRPMPPLETPGHSRASLGQALVGSPLLSPGSPDAQVSVCASKRHSNYLRYIHHLFFSILIVMHVWFDLKGRILIGGFQGGSVVKKTHLIMQETWVLSLGQEDPLEQEMTTHSSILAWKLPWTEGPGGLQSMGSQRVRHDLATKQQQL